MAYSRTLLIGLIAAASMTSTMAQDSFFTSAISPEHLNTLLATGPDESSTAAYWSCDVDTAEDTATDIPIRLWEDGTGFSGQNSVTWETENANTLSITYARGTFALSNVAFSNLRYEADGFLAVDADDKTVVCERIGPLRSNLQAGSGQLEDASSSLLKAQLLTAEGGAWECALTSADSAQVATQLQLTDGSNAKIDGNDARWFIDDRYNVILAESNKVQVIREITAYESYPDTSTTAPYTGISPAYFMGKILDKTISCMRH